VREPRWVPRLVVEATHLDQLREHGGLSGLRNEPALETALARPKQKWNFDWETGLALRAAAYAFGLSTARAFRDGNTRIAFLTAVIFLGLNGEELDATERDVVEAMTALAGGTLSEDDLATWIRERMVERSR